MKKNDQNISLSPLKITVIYLIVAGIWIAFTDRLLESLVSDAQALSILQTYKGWFYVLLTGAGLYWLIKKHGQQLQKKEVRLENLLNEVKSEKELKDVLFERIPILITIYDPDLEEFEVNREFEKVIGWTNDEVRKENIALLEACFPDLETREGVVNFMNNPGLGWKEIDTAAKSGKKISISWTNVRLTDNTSVGIGIDMTDIKASQAKIRESRELLKKIFESLESSLIVIDTRNRTIVDCNSATEKIFGYSEDELAGKSTKMLHVDNENYRKFDEMGAKSLEENGVFQTEYKMRRKDGTVFHSDHTVTLVQDEDGEVNKAVSVVRDITDRKNREKELQKRKDFIENTLANLPIGVAVNTIDDGQVTLMNKQFANIYGWPQKTLKNFESFFKKVYPDKEYRKQVFDMISADIASGNPDRMQWKGIRVTTREGKKRIVDAKNIPLYDQNLMISTVIDVTQQKELEQKLRKSEKKYRHLFKDNPEPMWIYDPETLEFVEVNQAAINHYGYSEEEFMNRTLLDIRPEEDAEALKENIKQNKGTASYSEEWVHLKKDGTKIDVELSASDVTYKKEKTYRLVLINDVTEQKRMQEKIIQSLIEGEDRERKRIAHELHDGLGQYLVAASMNLQSAKTDIEKLSEKRQKQFETGISHLKNALSETRNIAHDLMPKAISDYGLIAALENLINDFNKSTEIDFQFNHNCDELKLSDQAEINIYRIFQEILTNAVRHSECTKTNVELHLKNDSLKLMVKDNGIGAQLDEHHEETGLGLRSIKTRVSSLKGILDINSEPGDGMQTTIIIPSVNNLKYNDTDHG